MTFTRNSENYTADWSRLSFPKLWKPEPIVVQGRQIGDPRFSCLLVLDDRAAAEIQGIEQRLIQLSWPEWVGGQPPAGIAFRHAVQRGDAARPGDPYLAGRWVMSANAAQNKPPRVLMLDPQTGERVQVPQEMQHLVYSGCEAHVNVGIYTTQLKVTEPQINVGLNKVLLTGRQMPSFGAYTTDEQAFGDGPATQAPPMPPDAGEGMPASTPPASQVRGAPPPAGPQGGYQQVPPQQGTRAFDPNDPTTW